MIESFIHRGLEELFTKGKSGKVNPDLVKRVRVRLAALHAAKSLLDLDQPGFECHPLHTKPVRYSISVNGPWRITFEWKAGHATLVNLEQYH